MIIYYTRFSQKWDMLKWNAYISRMPELIKDKIHLFKRWQDRQSTLLGKLLLMEALRRGGYAYNISELSITKFGRPFFNKNLDFNISHSGNVVVCVISKNARVGIDVEEIQDIIVEDFKNVFNKKEWHSISNSHTPIKNFYKLWTIKESVIKADGRGLSIPLTVMDVFNDRVIYRKNIWHIREINLDPMYSFCLASDKDIGRVKLMELIF